MVQNGPIWVLNWAKLVYNGLNWVYIGLNWAKLVYSGLNWVYIGLNRVYIGL